MLWAKSVTVISPFDLHDISVITEPKSNYNGKKDIVEKIWFFFLDADMCVYKFDDIPMIPSVDAENATESIFIGSLSSLMNASLIFSFLFDRLNDRSHFISYWDGWMCVCMCHSIESSSVSIIIDGILSIVSLICNKFSSDWRHHLQLSIVNGEEAPNKK